MIPNIYVKLDFILSNNVILDTDGEQNIDDEIVLFIYEYIKCFKNMPATMTTECVVNKEIQNVLIFLRNSGYIYYSDYLSKWVVPPTARLFEWRMEK